MPSLMSLKSIRIYVQNKGGRKETQQMLSSPLRQYRGLVSDVRDLTPPRAHAHPACDAMGTIAKVRRVTAGPWASWGKGRKPLLKVLCVCPGEASFHSYHCPIPPITL